MNALQRGLLLAAVQVAIVSSLGAKLSWDRYRLPRAWANAVSYDPNLPIRGRYLTLQLEVRCDDVPAAVALPSAMSRPNTVFAYTRSTLRVEQGRLASSCSSAPEGVSMLRRQQPGGAVTTNLSEPVLFFLPEHAEDPWKRARGGELWAEVTVPKNGPPRPIRLAVKKGDAFTPLEIK
jgi:hypothetical protein